MIPEPEKVIVDKYWTAVLPHISNVLDQILAELKIMNANRNNKEE